MKLGLTGGMGSGKSRVAALLQRHGASIFDSDRAAQTLLRTDRTLRRGLQALLGADRFDADAPGLPREAIKRYLLASPENAARINALVHPRVVEAWRQFCETPAPHHVVESALLFESGLADEVDEVWAVFADEETRIARIMARDGRTRAEAEAFLARQTPLSAHLPRIARLIQNADGTTDAELLQQLRPLG